MQTEEVNIEQRIEEPGRFLIFSGDDAIVFAVPTMIGVLAKDPILGAVAGLALYFLWRKLKGENGIERLKAAVYWYTPAQLTPYRSFPPSHVIFWRG